jgi:hypothetical protein
VKPIRPRFSIASEATERPATNLSRFARGFEEHDVSKKTKKRRLKARRNKANHGRKPRAGR